jgi:hypothetical protein
MVVRKAVSTAAIIEAAQCAIEGVAQEITIEGGADRHLNTGHNARNS